MMPQIPQLALAFMLQSNDMIAHAVGNGQTLELNLAAYQGITGIFAQFFLIFIRMFAGLVHNYGLAIILTAILMRVALLPLTRQQIRGMKVMQMLQPVMKEIQRFYPNKQEQSSKMMELYQTYKINPLSGCLPMLIQLPILFGVYRALYDASFCGKDFLGIQLVFPANVTGGRSYGVGPDLADLIDITVSKLGLQHQIIRLPEAIPLIGGMFWYIPALALVALYVITSLWMQRVMRKVNAPDPAFAEEFKEEMKAKDSGPKEPDMAQQMQRQMGMMNFMIIIFAFIFSAGALLYFVMQNILMVLEYTFLPRGMNLALDPKEMKAFVRRSPAGKEASNAPPTPTAASAPQAAAQPLGCLSSLLGGGRPAVPQDSGGSAYNSSAGSAPVEGNNSDNNEGAEDGADDASGASAATILQRPRKKRRKR